MHTKVTQSGQPINKILEAKTKGSFDSNQIITKTINLFDKIVVFGNASKKKNNSNFFQSIICNILFMELTIH